MTSIDERLQKVLEDCFSKPILRLKETHPEYSFTEQGFGTLTDNAITEIKKVFVGMLPEEEICKILWNELEEQCGLDNWDMPDLKKIAQAILTKLEGK